MPITNPEDCRALHLKELLWVSLGVPWGSRAHHLQEVCLGRQLDREVPQEH